jgi:hypothetical protein
LRLGGSSLNASQIHTRGNAQVTGCRGRSVSSTGKADSGATRVLAVTASPGVCSVHRQAAAGTSCGLGRKGNGHAGALLRGDGQWQVGAGKLEAGARNSSLRDGDIRFSAVADCYRNDEAAAHLHIAQIHMGGREGDLSGCGVSVQKHQKKSKSPACGTPSECEPH